MNKMNNKEKKMNILDFKIFDELSEYTDSLLFDNETIATLTTNKYRVTIEVVGDKRIIFENQVYKSANKYPDKLIEIIKSGNFLDNDEIEIVDNNWFEIDIYESDTIVNDEVLEINIHTMTKEDLKQYMIRYLENYIEKMEEFSKSDDCTYIEMEEI